MDEKLAIETFIALRKEWVFYIQLGNVAKASEVFQKMIALGNKYPQIAQLINTAKLGPQMLNAGFTAGETTTTIGIIETTIVTETAVTTTGTATGATGAALATESTMMAAFVPVMTIGAAIAIAIVLGGVAFILYQNWSKDRAHGQFVDYARKTIGNPNRGFKPFLGRVH